MIPIIPSSIQVILESVLDIRRCAALTTWFMQPNMADTDVKQCRRVTETEREAKKSKLHKHKHNAANTKILKWIMDLYSTQRLFNDSDLDVLCDIV